MVELQHNESIQESDEQRLARSIANTLFDRLTEERIDSLVEEEGKNRIADILQNKNHNFSEEEKRVAPFLIKMELLSLWSAQQDKRDALVKTIREKREQSQLIDADYWERKEAALEVEQAEIEIQQRVAAKLEKQQQQGNIPSKKQLDPNKIKLNFEENDQKN
jgi:hypothetical protein